MIQEFEMSAFKDDSEDIRAWFGFCKQRRLMGQCEIGSATTEAHNTGKLTPLLKIELVIWTI